MLTGGDKAAAAVGQGEVRLNALNLAPITATIEDGPFRQPLFVSPGMSGLSTAHRLIPFPAAQRRNCER